MLLLILERTSLKEIKDLGFYKFGHSSSGFFVINLNVLIIAISPESSDLTPFETPGKSLNL